MVRKCGMTPILLRTEQAGVHHDMGNCAQTEARVLQEPFISSHGSPKIVPSSSEGPMRGTRSVPHAWQSAVTSSELPDPVTTVGQNRGNADDNDSKVGDRQSIAERSYVDPLVHMTSPTSPRGAASPSFGRDDMLKWTDLQAVDEIGVGGFGVVYRMEHKQNGKEYAVKLVDLKGNPDALGELGALQSLPLHPNVTTLHKGFISPSRLYLVFDYCRGGDLFSVLSSRALKRHLTERVVAHCVRQICSAVAHLHEHGMVHNDITPKNILVVDSTPLKADGRPGSPRPLDLTGPHGLHVQLADFGLSRILAENESMPSRTGGSVFYFAPEKLKGQPYGKPLDMWAIGVVTFIMLCGYHPFDEYGSGDQALTKERIRRCQWNFVGDVWKHVSPLGKLFVTNLLQENPAFRPTAATALCHPWLRADSADDMDDTAPLDPNITRFMRSHMHADTELDAPQHTSPSDSLRSIHAATPVVSTAQKGPDMTREAEPPHSGQSSALAHHRPPSGAAASSNTLLKMAARNAFKMQSDAS